MKTKQDWTQDRWEGFRQGVKHRNSRSEKVYYTDRYGHIMFRGALGDQPASNEDYAIGYMTAFLVVV